MEKEKQNNYQTVLLLGNGFDLHYKLLTRYQDFLLTVAFLAEQEDLSKFKTYADLLGCAELLGREDHKAHSLVRDNWDRYKGVYERCKLPIDDIRRLTDIAKENMWFKYLLKSFNKDVGWIDFEREIAVVLECFKALFAAYDDGIRHFDIKCFNQKHTAFVVTGPFGFCMVRNKVIDEKGRVSYDSTYDIRQDFLVEYPKGSAIKVLNRERIANCLCDSLKRLSVMLEIYLLHFADDVFLQWLDSCCFVYERERERCLWHHVSEKALALAVNFNYSNTFDMLRFERIKVAHIHGRLLQDPKGRIVLGINPDNDDLIDSVNTDFIQFKKYFQRVFYGTDLPYLKAVDDLRYFKAKPDTKLGLVVMGHSLDVTDRDIIEELVNLADRVTILYHTDSAVASYISNLVRIFGKAGFDDIRTRKRLKFQSIREAEVMATSVWELDHAAAGMT